MRMVLSTGSFVAPGRYSCNSHYGTQPSGGQVLDRSAMALSSEKKPMPTDGLEVVKVQRQGLAVFVQGDHWRAGRGSRLARLLFFFAESFLLGLFGLPLLAGAFFGALGKCRS